MRVLRREDPARTGAGVARRRAASTLDFILVLGVIMPLATIVVPTGMRIIRAVYDMTVVMVAWPFL